VLAVPRGTGTASLPSSSGADEAIAVDLPADDDRAGLAAYTDVVVDAIGDRRPIVLAAQSLGGFTAPLVCERVPVELLILVNAMVPLPGETGQEWWTATGWEDEVGEIDMDDAFFHDVPDDVKAVAGKEEPPQSGTPLVEPWPLEKWPDVPTRLVQGRDDRFFPLEFQRRVVRERLGIELDEVPGGHLVALSRPVELVDTLMALAQEEGRG
jgi:pimeloyl-ACP methyl ester carboxylesterase